MPLTVAIPKLRDSIAAIFRLRLSKPESIDQGKIVPAQFEVGWVLRTLTRSNQAMQRTVAPLRCPPFLYENTSVPSHARSRQRRLIFCLLRD